MCSETSCFFDTFAHLLDPKFSRGPMPEGHVPSQMLTNSMVFNTFSYEMFKNSMFFMVLPLPQSHHLNSPGLPFKPVTSKRPTRPQETHKRQAGGTQAHKGSTKEPQAESKLRRDRRAYKRHARDPQGHKDTRAHKRRTLDPKAYTGPTRHT